jgi:hypothetical protein
MAKRKRTWTNNYAKHCTENHSWSNTKKTGYSEGHFALSLALCVIVVLSVLRFMAALSVNKRQFYHTNVVFVNAKFINISEIKEFFIC